MRSVAAALLLSACAHAQPLQDIDPSGFVLEDTGGARVRLSSYEGQVVLLNFFATWCFFCLGDIERLRELQDRRGQEGLQVIAVGLDREGALVLAPFKEFNHLNFPVLIGADRFAAPGLPFAPVNVLPTTYLVGRDGRVREEWQGQLPDKLLEEVVDAALKR